MFSYSTKERLAALLEIVVDNERKVNLFNSDRSHPINTCRNSRLPTGGSFQPS
jgi:hypothetical protein